MRIFKNIFLFILIAAGALSACKGTEKSEETEARIEAAMMEGRNAARPFLTRNPHDTVGLSTEVYEAHRKARDYADAGFKRSGETFDSAFARTIRAVNPALYAVMTK